MSRGKRSLWKSTLSLFANVSWKTLVLEIDKPHFLRMSGVKRSLWYTVSLFANVSGETLIWKPTFSLFANVSCETKGTFSLFANVSCETLIWKPTFSLFANVSCETLALEGDISRFANVSCENTRRTDGGHMSDKVWRRGKADTRRTHGGQVPGTWREQPFFPRKNPTANYLGNHFTMPRPCPTAGHERTKSTGEGTKWT